MKKVIEFCYTGKVKVARKEVIDLVIVADVYNIRELKKRCTAFLKRIIDDGTCVLIWSVAQVCKINSLEKLAADYILASEDVLNDFEVQGIPRDDLSLMLNLFPKDYNREFVRGLFGMPGENENDDQPPRNM